MDEKIAKDIRDELQAIRESLDQLVDTLRSK